METIAVYWEEPIRVYGLSEKRALTLLHLEFPLDRLGDWAEALGELESCGSFEIVFLQTTGAVGKLFLVPSEVDTAGLETLLHRRLANETETVLHRSTPVAVLYLHGPHFQDRYGIAEAALSPLQQANVFVHAMGCTGTSIYLVIDDQAVETARTALAKTFVL